MFVRLTYIYKVLWKLSCWKKLRNISHEEQHLCMMTCHRVCHMHGSIKFWSQKNPKFIRVSLNGLVPNTIVSHGDVLPFIMRAIIYVCEREALDKPKNRRWSWWCFSFRDGRFFFLYFFMISGGKNRSKAEWSWTPNAFSASNVVQNFLQVFCLFLASLHVVLSILVVEF